MEWVIYFWISNTWLYLLYLFTRFLLSLFSPHIFYHLSFIPSLSPFIALLFTGQFYYPIILSGPLLWSTSLLPAVISPYFLGEKMGILFRLPLCVDRLCEPACRSLFPLPTVPVAEWFVAFGCSSWWGFVSATALNARLRYHRNPRSVSVTTKLHSTLT